MVATWTLLSRPEEASILTKYENLLLCEMSKGRELDYSGSSQAVYFARVRVVLLLSTVVANVLLEKTANRSKDFSRLVTRCWFVLTSIWRNWGTMT